MIKFLFPMIFFQEDNEIGRVLYEDHFQLTDDMKLKYTNTQTRSHPENTYARVSITAKSNHEIEQNDINKLVKMVYTRFSRLIQIYHFKYQVTAGCDYLIITKMSQMNVLLYQALADK